MADNTKIEWTDSTWNIITGCSVVSAGCRHCYAMKLAGTRLQHHPSRADRVGDRRCAASSRSVQRAKRTGSTVGLEVITKEADVGRKALLVQVTVFDEDTGDIEQTIVKTYEGNYGYEIRRFFERLGERFSKLLDPSDDF